MDASSLVPTKLYKEPCHCHEYIDVVDLNDDASMDEIYVTYADDEHVDNHGYDDSTDDDHDNNYVVYGHISVIYRWSIDEGYIGPSLGINLAPIGRDKMILIPIETLYKNLQF